MTQKKIIYLLAFVILFCGANSHGGIYTAVNNGAWTTASTWDCMCIPGSTDNVIIPSGKEVTILTPGAILLNSAIITITVNGKLILSSSTLSVNSTDVITIGPAGRIEATGLGGSIWSGVTPFLALPYAGPATISSGVLPIQLEFFRATERQCGVLLEWKTLMEKDLSHFVYREVI